MTQFVTQQGIYRLDKKVMIYQIKSVAIIQKDKSDSSRCSICFSVDWDKSLLGRRFKYCPKLISINYFQDSCNSMEFYHETISNFGHGGVNDIGRNWLLMTLIGFFFGTGITSAFAQGVGKRCFAKLLFKTKVIGQERMSAYSFKIQFGMPSEPVALFPMRHLNSLRT